MRLPPEKKQELILLGQFLEHQAVQPFLIFMKRLEDTDMLEKRRANATGNAYIPSLRAMRSAGGRSGSTKDIEFHISVVKSPKKQNVEKNEEQKRRPDFSVLSAFPVIIEFEVRSSLP